MEQRTVDRLLTRIYYNLESGASFAGLNTLWQTAKKYHTAITKSEVRKWLENQMLHNRFRRPRKPRGKAWHHTKYVTTAPMMSFSCDTALFRHSKLPYALVCKDTFSSKTYASMQRNLKSNTTVRNIKRMIDNQNKGRWPVTIYTDKGNEWRKLNTLPVVHKTTHGRFQKANLAEQAIKMIRTKLERYSTLRGTNADLSKVLPKIVTSLNNTLNSRTGLTPIQAERPENAGLVFRRKYANYLATATKPPEFNVGQFIRILLPDRYNNFAKKSKPGFSEEVFQVVRVRNTVPHTYIVEDSTNRQVEGYFYGHDLIKAEPDYKQWRIVDRVLEEKPTKLLVTFKGYPSAYKRWIPRQMYDSLRKSFEERIQ